MQYEIEGVTEAQQKILEVLRDPETHKLSKRQLAKRAKVSYGTVLKATSNPAFLEACLAMTRFSLAFSGPMAASRIIEKAQSGNLTACRMILEALGIITSRVKVDFKAELQIKKAFEGMSHGELRQRILHALDGGGYAERDGDGAKGPVYVPGNVRKDEGPLVPTVGEIISSKELPARTDSNLAEK